MKQIFGIFLLFSINNCNGKRLPRSTCFVADSIQLHNSSKKWWWSPFRRGPVVGTRPRDLYYNKEWLVYMSPSNSGTTAMEFAYRTEDGNCRFLIRRLQRSTVEFGEETRCRPHQNGNLSYFTVSFDPLTNRQHITTGNGNFVDSKVKQFIGLRGRSLHVTNIRSRFMRWWTINFSAYKTC